MACRNPYTPGSEILACSDYCLGSHGCASATYESMANADLPDYAHGFYSPTEHEALSDIRYSKTEIGYDNNLMEIKRALEGAPLEAYVPSAHVVEDSGSAAPKTGEVIEPIVIKKPSKKVVEEIIKAQKEVTGREIILREMEIEEIIIRRRRIKKREVRLKEKD